jgi:hypothetical protein
MTFRGMLLMRVGWNCPALFALWAHLSSDWRSCGSSLVRNESCPARRIGDRKLREIVAARPADVEAPYGQHSRNTQSSGRVAIAVYFERRRCFGTARAVRGSGTALVAHLRERATSERPSPCEWPTRGMGIGQMPPYCRQRRPKVKNRHPNSRQQKHTVTASAALLGACRVRGDV